jgi:two-component system sensor histidine kinase DesK
MDSRNPSMPHAAMVRTARAILLVRVVAILSVLPLLWSITALWSQPQLGVAPIPSPYRAPAWVGTVFIAGTMALYLLYAVRIWPARRPVWTAAVLLGMATMVALEQVLALTPATTPWLYVAVVAGAALRPWRAGLAVLAMAVASQPERLLSLPQPPGAPGGPDTWVRLLQIWVPLVATSVTQLVIGALSGMLVTSLVRTTAELYAARSGLARLAVEEERTRLARDLHDLLGHNLLLMAVKLELAGRLIRDPDQPGAAEIREVQQMTRETLRDVREVVGGYRQPTLEGELAGAAVALEAAGIALELSDQHGVLTPTLEATCAWLIREGVTNVIKHSGARTCQICLRRDADQLLVGITDDGTGGRANGSGAGLRGLSERVATLHGTLTAAAAASGAGFQLTARLPVDQAAAEDGAD